MKKIKKSTTFFVIFASLMFLLFLGTRMLRGGDLNPTKNIRKEIIGLNLINGLELSQEQMEIILKGAEERKQIAEDFQKLILHLNDDVDVELKEIKACLDKGKNIPSSTAQRFHKISNEIKRKKRETEERIRKLAASIKEILEPHQFYQLQEFIPCIIPPEGELRIGQAGNNRGLLRNLEKIRKIPYRIYERRRGDIIDRTLEGMKLHMPPGKEIKENELKKHIQKVFRKTRMLSDTDFEIRKGELAEELISPIKPSHPQNNTVKTVEDFLLCPEIIPILQEKLLSYQDSPVIL